MALNQITPPFEPQPPEKLLFHQPSVEFELETGGGYPGNTGTYYCPTGELFLTNTRIIYISTLEHFKSFQVPIALFKDGQLVQPWLGSNYYSGVVFPVENGGLNSPGTLKLTFPKGGAFVFSQMFQELRERIAENDGKAPEHLETLPTYSPHPEGGHVSLDTPPPAYE